MKTKCLFVILGSFFLFLKPIKSQSIEFAVFQEYINNPVDWGQGLSGGRYSFSPIANIGDVDGDGIDDLAIGAYGSGSESGGGVIFICFQDEQGITSNFVPISEGINGFNEDYANSLDNEGNLLNFDGIDDYVDANDLAFHLAGKENFTIEFWMRAGSQPEIRTSLFSINKPSPGDNEFLMVLGETSNPGDEKLNIYDQNNPNGRFVLQSPDDITGKCHHIAYVKKGNVGEAFVDGVSIGTHTIYYSITENHRVSFGQDYDGINTSEFYDGNLWGIAIWNTARSANQISVDAQYDLSGNEEDLIAYYDANQGDVVNSDTCSRDYCLGQNNLSETSLNDLTSNGLNLKLKNFTLDGDSSNWIRKSCGGYLGAEFGKQIVGLGDINGDGIPDIAVSAPSDVENIEGKEDWESRPGAVYVLRLNRDGTVKGYQKIGENEGGLVDWGEGRRFGESIASIGDVNGDGIPDLAIGALYDQDWSGAIYIVHLDTSGTVRSQSKILPKGPHFSNRLYDSFAKNIENMGDVNGDGNFDLLVSMEVPQVWLLYLNENQEVIGSKFYDVLTDSVFYEVFGNISDNPILVSSIPDVNQDGIKEMIVSRNDEYGDLKAGIFLINEFGEIIDYSLLNVDVFEPSANLGTQDVFVSCLGDINNDFYPEISIGGSPWHMTGNGYSSSLFVLTVKPEKCISDCVWPGDANNDGIVNSKDILQMGCSFWQNSDNKRIMSSTDWIEQHCDKWETEINKVNAKHADSDGNGIVNFSDVPAVDKNYSKVSFKMAETVPTDPLGPPLYIIPNKDTVTHSDSISYSISFGSSENPAENIYGVSMKLQHDAEDLFGSDNTANFSGSWLGTKNVDMIATGFPLEDGIDIGMARIDQTNRAGYGYLAKVDIVTPDNLVEINKDLVWELTNLTIVSYEGDTTLPNVIYGDPVVILRTKKLQNPLLDKVVFSPNPSNGILELSSLIKFDLITVYDISGRLMKSFSKGELEESIDLSDLPRGLYILKIQSGIHTDNRRVVLK